MCGKASADAEPHCVLLCEARHRFHEACISPLLQQRPACPVDNSLVDGMEIVAPGKPAVSESLLPTCCVCWERMGHQAQIGELACGATPHQFHITCIDEWLSESASSKVHCTLPVVLC